MARESRNGKYHTYEIKILKYLDRFFKYPFYDKGFFDIPLEHHVPFSSIFNELGIPKTSSHDTLKKLIEKGFVKKVIQLLWLDLGKKHIYADGYRITMNGHIYLNS